MKGFADSSGNAAMNQNLSMERAQNVIAFLLQDCNVPVRHIVAPGATSEVAYQWPRTRPRPDARKTAALKSRSC